MFRSLFLAAALMAFTPLAANASEITLLPSIKLQIGDRDHYGNYWDGGHWRDQSLQFKDAIVSLVERSMRKRRQEDTGQSLFERFDRSVKRMSVAIVKAGAIVTIIVEKAADMDTAIKRIRQWSTMPDATLARLIRPTNQLFNA